ncbi:hypothetical protein [Bradyrhizobium sp. Leo121]|uniref:hypothetical protein n=1 Tax=Bradyrhizobium sp. Leo121 TaxID=1571195 RepID=UPI001028AAF4|nr:hypothetical protein [Bradyrhizobium sp. Leo121]
MDPETAAFGYLRERLFRQQRVLRPLAIRDMRRVVLTASGGLMASEIVAGAFVPNLLPLWLGKFLGAQEPLSLRRSVAARDRFTPAIVQGLA